MPGAFSHLDTRGAARMVDASSKPVQARRALATGRLVCRAATIRLLLSCGARIDEINTLRRQLDRVKGGGLAHATKAKIISLILSDVIGNPLETIASGPTVPNPTTSEDAFGILRKYGIEKQVPSSILHILTSTSSQDYSSPNEEAASSGFDTSKKLPLLSHHHNGIHVQNIIIGDNKIASVAAMEQAQREGFDAQILTNELQGEAREVGVSLAKRLCDEVSKRERPFCLIAGGETTVTIKGDGKGGRNQELVLAAVNGLRDMEHLCCLFLSQSF